MLLAASGIINASFRSTMSWMSSQLLLHENNSPENSLITRLITTFLAYDNLVKVIAAFFVFVCKS